MDFGMEHCVLSLRLPPSNLNPSTILSNGSIELCELDTDRMLDMRTLSWVNRPNCRRNLGTFVPVPDGEVVLHEFPCAWGTIPTFEVSCSAGTPNCMLDVWGSVGKAWGKSAISLSSVIVLKRIRPHPVSVSDSWSVTKQAHIVRSRTVQRH